MNHMPVSTTPPSPAASPLAPDVRYQQLFDQAPVSIQILSPDGLTVRVNKAWEKLWQIHAGTPLHDYVFSPAYNVLHDPQLIDSGIAALLARACAGEMVELPAVRYDVNTLGGTGPGPVRWVTARAHPIKDSNGKVQEVMLMHEDITAQVINESALRLREERFRSLVMATSQIVWVNTADGRVVEDSPSWRAFTGQTYEQWQEFGWLEALHPDDRDATKAHWLACVASRSVFEINYRLRRLDGSYRWTAVKGVPIIAADGSIREWIGANTDIHDRVMAEAELAQRLAREKHSNALLAKVAQAGRTLHTVLSRDDIAQALVTEVRDILQVQQASVSLADDFSGAPALSAVARADHLATALAADAGHAVPLLDRMGRTIGLIEASGRAGGRFTEEDEAILAQLASIAATGFENARLYASLQEQDRRKDEFLAMLAHELRNPLAPISAAAEVLKLSAPQDDRVRRSSDIISRQVRHMASLVDDLLDVSRVTHGLIELDTALLDPAAIVASAVEQSQPLIAHRGHQLTVSGDSGDTRIVGDAKRLVQVLVNLLNNAAKYTPNGGHIWLTMAYSASQVVFTVRDNGVGIDAQLLPQVFDLFTQAERSPDRAQSGLGIGLALVRTIVTMHGGQVTADSAGPGAGSSFTVTLQAASAAGQAAS
jgi:PAS domain S-box-containing protein